MFGVSFAELIIVFIAAFLIVGPKRMQEFAGQLGSIIGKMKSQWTEFKHTQLLNMDTSSLYDTKIELNKSVEELQNAQKQSCNSEQTPSTTEKLPSHKEPL